MAPEPEAACLNFAGKSLREAIGLGGRALEGGGVEGAMRDARLLLLEALGLSATDLLREPERRLSEAEAARLADFLRRRLAREPVSRIIGTRGFYGRTFKITPATLDPRPCTETVIEAALEVVDREGWRRTPIHILDVGTGTGALLITLLAELPMATGVGTDISDAALAVARENASLLGVAERATFLNRRTLDGIEGEFHLLVSNPPYISTSEIASLEPEVRDYDPFSALDGGLDGLAIYRALTQGLQRVVPDGWVLFEVGAGQATDVAQMLRSAAGAGPSPEIRVWKDFGHHERCVAVRTHR